MAHHLLAVQCHLAVQVMHASILQALQSGSRERPGAALQSEWTGVAPACFLTEALLCLLACGWLVVCNTSLGLGSCRTGTPSGRYACARGEAHPQVCSAPDTVPATSQAGTREHTAGWHM